MEGYSCIIVTSIISTVFVLASFLVFHAIFKKKMQYWIVSDISRGLNNFFLPKPNDSIHIMFCFVDHFEPGNGNAAPEQQKARVDAWVERFPELASKHKDSDGVYPQHTFFFPPHYNTHDHLKKLVSLSSMGFGEIEMHLHHDRMEPWQDDELSLRKKVLECIEAYSRYGVFCLPDGTRTYGFIHGDWALSNSLKDGKHCGINDELTILQETGCYADFTFPICNEAQPRMANTVFYAKSCASFPKGYNSSAVPVARGKIRNDGLMIIQGIIGLRWKSRTHRFKPSIEQSNISKTDFPFESRIDYWVKKRIHVKEKPNWIFVKLHTHGASAQEGDREILLGKSCDEMYSYLESKYNQGKYFLHYVSAREMFNIIKAAENQKNGNPNLYRDYKIPRYIYLP